MKLVFFGNSSAEQLSSHIYQDTSRSMQVSMENIVMEDAVLTHWVPVTTHVKVATHPVKTPRCVATQRSLNR